jgi:hypothetical protein
VRVRREIALVVCRKGLDATEIDMGLKVPEIVLCVCRKSLGVPEIDVGLDVTETESWAWTCRKLP